MMNNVRWRVIWHNVFYLCRPKRHLFCSNHHFGQNNTKTHHLNETVLFWCLGLISALNLLIYPIKFSNEFWLQESIQFHPCQILKWPYEFSVSFNLILNLWYFRFHPLLTFKLLIFLILTMISLNWVPKFTLLF